VQLSYGAQEFHVLGSRSGGTFNRVLVVLTLPGPGVSEKKAASYRRSWSRKTCALPIDLDQLVVLCQHSRRWLAWLAGLNTVAVCQPAGKSLGSPVFWAKTYC